MRAKTFALALACGLLVAGLAHGAPSHVEIATRGPQAQQPDLAQGDEDAARPGTQVRPRAGQPHGFPADVIVHDENGHNDVRRVNVTLLRADNATVHRAPVEASKLSGSGTRATWRVTVTMLSDDPPGEYILRAAVVDRDAAVTLAWTNFTYEPLAALAVATSRISLGPSGSGALEPGADGTSAPAHVNVTNAGNVAVDITLAATDLANATHGASIPASSLLASRTSDVSSGLALSEATQTLPGASLASNETAPVWMGLRVPPGLRPGDYVGELTLGAVAAS